MGRASVPTPAVYPAFFFVLEKAAKIAGNAVILTFPAHCPHGLQHLRYKRPTFTFVHESGYTLGSPRKIAHKGTHAEIGGVLGGGAIITLDTSYTFTNIPGPGVRTANFAAFGSWSGGALEERREPAEQRCAYARRCSAGVAAPLGCVIFFRFYRNYGFHTLCSRLSACARHRRYHYPRRALRASETLDSRLSKRLSCYSFHPS